MRPFSTRFAPLVPFGLVSFGLVSCAIALIVGGAASAAAQPARTPNARATLGSASTPLSDAARRIVEAVPDEGNDPPDEHYYRSNEWRQDLLRPHLEGLGGVFVGVGSDQNYTMAAMAGSDLLFLVDYDPLIPWVHATYRVLVLASDSPDALVARFDDESAAETEALLRRELASHPHATRIVRHWKSRRSAWHAYLVRVQRLVRDGQPFSWLADPAMYNHTRTLFQNGRVIARNGDVTGETTMRAVAEACRQLGAPVRAVYFSNAEQFFTYTDSFIENMRQLPTDDRSLVLRTIRHRNIEIAPDGRWHYLVQTFPDFQARLDTRVYRRSFALTADLLAAGAPHLGTNGISTMTPAVPMHTREAVRNRRAR